MKSHRSGTSQSLRNLRSLRVLVCHPNDHDGEVLIQQLQRIGCQVRAYWPALDRLGPDVDMVFLAVRPELLAARPAWSGTPDMPPVIAVVNYENPTVVEAVLNIGAVGVIASPVKSFGLLTTMVLARQTHADAQESRRHAERLEQRLASLRKLSKAKTIIMHARGISEEQAYEIIREQAMSKRTTTEEIAAAIINANEILGGSTPPA